MLYLKKVFRVSTYPEGRIYNMYKKIMLTFLLLPIFFFENNEFIVQNNNTVLENGKGTCQIVLGQKWELIFSISGTKMLSILIKQSNHK